MTYVRHCNDVSQWYQDVVKLLIVAEPFPVSVFLLYIVRYEKYAYSFLLAVYCCFSFGRRPYGVYHRAAQCAG